MEKNYKIILGSASRGRKGILEELGWDFEVMPADIDEKAIRCEDPKELTLMLARAKAETLVSKIKEPAILITSDQVVFCNGKILEKPENPEEARNYLKNYSQFPPQTVTSVVVTNTLTKKQASGVDIAKVIFGKIPDAVIEDLIENGDVFRHAGGFSIDYPELKDYILRTEGERESIIGLPKALTLKLIEEIKK